MKAQILFQTTQTYIELSFIVLMHTVIVANVKFIQLRYNIISVAIIPQVHTHIHIP